MLRECAAELGSSLPRGVFGQGQEEQVLDGGRTMQCDRRQGTSQAAIGSGLEARTSPAAAYARVQPRPGRAECHQMPRCVGHS